RGGPRPAAHPQPDREPSSGRGLPGGVHGSTRALPAHRQPPPQGAPRRRPPPPRTARELGLLQHRAGADREPAGRPRHAALSGAAPAVVGEGRAWRYSGSMATVDRPPGPEVTGRQPRLVGTRKVPRAVREPQMLEVAGRAFAARGFHEASMDEIAEGAGISKQMLYNH